MGEGQDPGTDAGWPGAGRFGSLAAQRVAAGYIRQYRGSYDRASIDQRLADAGYDPEDVALAWALVDAPPELAPSVPSEQPAADSLADEAPATALPERRDPWTGGPAPGPHALPPSRSDRDFLGRSAFWLGLLGGLLGMGAVGMLLPLGASLAGGGTDAQRPSYFALVTCSAPFLVSLAVLVFGLRRRRRADSAFGHGCVWSVFLGWGAVFIVFCGLIGLVAALIATGNVPEINR